MSNGKGENTEKMDSIEDPSNTLPTIVGEELIAEAENKLNEEAGEVVGNKTNEIRRKIDRPSKKDKDKEDQEDLPENKKVKKSPQKRRNLKVKSINRNGKPNGFNKLYKKEKKKKQRKMYLLSRRVPLGNSL